MAHRILLVVRGRAVRLLVRVVDPCRRVGWGERVFFVIVVRGHHKRTKRGKSREPMAFWVHAVSDGVGGVAVACAVGGVGVAVVAALGGGGGVSLDEERF
jgi:hypothetical protein